MNPTIDTDTLSQLAYVSLDDIAISKTNEMFRGPEDMLPAALSDLASSIRDKGLIQPVLLRPAPNKPDKYILVAGERRYRACRLVRDGFPDRTTLPAFIREMTDAEALELQIIENLQRENLNPIREANGFQYLVKEKKFSTAAIAAKIGKSMDYVQDRLRLAVLIPKAQKMITEGYLPLKAGLKLARIPDSKMQAACLDHCSQEFDLVGEQVSTSKLSLQQTSKYAFKGLDVMQEWMDRNLFTDLTRADFDKEDPKLNPVMGPCAGCLNRTKNSQGLFDDMIVDDKCLMPSCYRTKQINTYKRLRDELKTKFPTAKIIFKRRDNSIDGRSVFDKELAGLGELIGAGSGEIIADKKGRAMKRPTIAILVGISHSDESDQDEKGWVFWQPTQKKTRSVDPSQRGELTAAAKKQLTPDQQAAAERKIQDEDRKKAILEEAILDLAIDQVLKTQTEDKVLDIELEAMTEDCDWDFLHALPRIFQRLGMNWWTEKKEISHKGFDTIAARIERDGESSEPDILKSLQKASIAQKRVVLIMGRLMSYYYLAGKVEKLFGVATESARKQKASGKAGEIFKKWQADRDAQLEKAEKEKKEKALEAQAAKLNIYKGMGTGAISTKDAAAKLADLDTPKGKLGLKALTKPAAAGKKKGRAK